MKCEICIIKKLLKTVCRVLSLAGRFIVFVSVIIDLFLIAQTLLHMDCTLLWSMDVDSAFLFHLDFCIVSCPWGRLCLCLSIFLLECYSGAVYV